MTTTATATGSRCYGYTPAGDVVPREALVIKTAAGLVLEEDESLSRVCERLNESGARTVNGRPWSVATLVRLLTNPRLAGLSPKRRGSTEPAPAIITVAEHERLAAQAAERRQRAPRQRRGGTRLLSGLLRCGRCGSVMYAHSNTLQGRSYRCAPPAGTGGPCGRTQIQAEPLEWYVSARALGRLANHAAGPIKLRDPAAEIQENLARLEEYRAGLDAARASGTLSPDEYDAQRNRAKRRRYQLRVQLAAAARAPRTVLPDPDEAAAWWEAADLPSRQDVLAALWDRIVIYEPTARLGTSAVDVGRVSFMPRS